VLILLTVFATRTPSPPPPPAAPADLPAQISYDMGFEEGREQLSRAGIANCEALWDSHLIFLGDPNLNPGPPPEPNAFRKGCKAAGGF
jgi:hypothetical protein